MIYLTLRTQKPTAFKPLRFLQCTSLLQLFLGPGNFPFVTCDVVSCTKGYWLCVFRGRKDAAQVYVKANLWQLQASLLPAFPQTIHIFPPSDSTNYCSADFYCSQSALMVETKLCVCSANWLWFIAVFYILSSCPQNQIQPARTPYIRLDIGVWALWWNSE